MAGTQKSSRDSEPTFEQALARLEEIAHELEGGELPLERAIALAEEGIKLSQLCEKQLTAAEGRIQQLVERMGRPELEPFEPDEGEEE
jgi:exodeoxyribonuclease VII small subunit